MAKLCQKCGRSSFDNALFCSGCGTKLQRICAGCGGVIKEGTNFCGMCGIPVNPPCQVSQAVQEITVKHDLAAPAEKRQQSQERATNEYKAYKIEAVFALIAIALCGIYWFYLRPNLQVQQQAAVQEQSYSTQRDAPQVQMQEQVREQTGQEVQGQTRHQAETNSTSVNSNKQGQIKGTNVNLRAAPDMKARVIYCFPGWEYVTVLSATSPKPGKYPWYKVSYSGVTGWVYGQFLKQ